MLSINGKKVSISAVKTDCKLTPFTAKKNGTYFPEESDGFNKVVVEVEAEEKESVVLKPLTVTENRTYEGGIEDGKQVGYTPVVVDVKPDKSAVVKEIIALRGGKADWLFRADYPKSNLTMEQIEDWIKYDTFENATSMSAVFFYCTHITKFPKMNTSKVTNLEYCFNGCEGLEDAPDIDTSNSLAVNSLFQGCAKLTVIPSYDTKKATSAGYMLYNCHRVKIIGELDFRACTNFTLFGQLKELEEIWIKNLKANLVIGSGTSYGHLIKQECLIHLIKECRDTGSAKTLTIGSANLAKIADVYVRLVDITDEMRAEDDLIDEKLPFEVCESTDEGAMLITEYALLKNWQIAG